VLARLRCATEVLGFVWLCVHSVFDLPLLNSARDVDRALLDVGIYRT
jgi:hypothetical protein